MHCVVSAVTLSNVYTLSCVILPCSQVGLMYSEKTDDSDWYVVVIIAQCYCRCSASTLSCTLSANVVMMCIELCTVECVHGKCERQRCVCEEGWTGSTCDLRQCDRRCAVHGYCNNGSCECRRGWNGRHCSLGRFTACFALFLLNSKHCDMSEARSNGCLVLVTCTKYTTATQVLFSWQNTAKSWKYYRIKLLTLNWCIFE